MKSEAIDLTKIEKPFYLLDAETQARLQAHPGPIEMVSGSGWTVNISRANAAPAIDLTENRMAFDLLDDATKAAFEAHVAAGGNVERYTGGVLGWFPAVPAWSRTGIYRAVPLPKRGEVVMFGTKDGFSETPWKPDTHSLTLPTLDGVLICGTYTGPDGAQVVIAEVAPPVRCLAFMLASISREIAGILQKPASVSIGCEAEKSPSCVKT